MTAKEFLNKDESGVYNEQDITQTMIMYAKLHVEAALKAVNENVKLLVDDNKPDKGLGEGEDLLDYYECGSDTIYVSSSSILNAYPLTNIV